MYQLCCKTSRLQTEQLEPAHVSYCSPFRGPAQHVGSASRGQAVWSNLTHGSGPWLVAMASPPTGWLGLVATVVATGFSVAEEDSPGHSAARLRCAHEPVARVSHTAHPDLRGWRGSRVTLSHGRGAMRQAWEAVAASVTCRCIGIPTSHQAEWRFIPTFYLRHRARPIHVTPPPHTTSGSWPGAPSPRHKTRPGQDAPVKSSGSQGHLVQEGKTEGKTCRFR